MISTNNLLSSMNETLEKAKLSCGIPGMSVAILYKGEIIYAKAIGELVAEGKMDWDKTPVSRYLPEFELQDPILTSQLTMVDLLSHRTGFPDIDIAWFRNATPRRDLIKQMKYVKMETKLSSDALYNNVMYAVAGEAAANVAGVSYEKLVADKVLNPLGLTNTGFGPMEMKQRPNYAMPYGAASLDDAKKGRYELGYLDEVYAADSPAGDMYSNVLDLVRWGRVIIKHGALDGKQVLNKESVQETLNGYTFMNKKRRGPEFAPVQSYGLGWCLDSYKGHIIYRHNGSVPGYRSELALVPNSDLVIACLANIDAVLLTNISYHVLDEILDLPKTQDWIASEFVKETLGIYENYTNVAKGDLPERIENRPPAHGLGAYVGDYSHPVYGSVSVRLEKNRKDGTEDEEELLFFKMRTFDGKMEHYHFDSFKAFLHDFVVKLTILANFQTGQDGKVEGFKIDFGQGPLEFRRK